MTWVLDITVEIVEIDPDNQYIFIEGPWENGRQRIKMHGLDPDGMTVGEGMYIPLELWDKWCLMWDTGTWDCISWHA